METKYNLNITTSGENGDNATTSISTTDANKLAELLQLAGMSQSHPVALNVSPEEEYDAPCSDCGESPCGCEGMTEGESWDNEPEVTVHSPEEVLKVGDDLHKVKKSYPPVAGGDNPMALESAENKLRNMYDEFIAESEEEVEEVEEAITAKHRTPKEVPHRARKSLEKEEVEEEVEEVHEESADLADIRKLAGLDEAAGKRKPDPDGMHDLDYKTPAAANAPEKAPKFLVPKAPTQKKPSKPAKPAEKGDGKGTTWGVVA